MKRAPGNLLTGLLLATAGMALFGCKSLKQPAAASFASVRIQGHTAEQIRGATVVVFQQDGYTLAGAKGSDLVFERQGSRWDELAYGSWVEGVSVWLRIKVSMVPLSPDDFRLQCQAYKVHNKDDLLAEEEVRMSAAHSKSCQALLDKVLAQISRP